MEKRERGAAILWKPLNRQRLDYLRLALRQWKLVSRWIIASLAKEKQKPGMTGREMAAKFENEHADSFGIKSTDPDQPWHPAIGIRMPPLQKPWTVGAHTGADGTLKITNLDRWKYYKEKMAGPTDTSCWLLAGATDEAGNSATARVLFGGYPHGRASESLPLGANNNALTSLLLSGIDTFVCLMTREELFEVERDVLEFKPTRPGGFHVGSPARRKDIRKASGAEQRARGTYS